MVTGRDIEPNLVAFLVHHPVGTDVYLAIVGIAGYYDIASSNIPPPILLVPLGRRENIQIDFTAMQRILENRTIANFLDGG